MSEPPWHRVGWSGVIYEVQADNYMDATMALHDHFQGTKLLPRGIDIRRDPNVLGKPSPRKDD